MTTEEMLLNLFFSILGAFIGAFLAIWRENLAKPNLVIKPGSFGDGSYQHIGRSSRFIHLKVINKEWPRWWQRFFYGLRSAHSCKAKLDFIDPITKSTIFSIQGRWNSTPEPLIPITSPNVGIFDPARAMHGEIETILPNEEKEITIALKFEGDDEFFGFNNWSYLFSNWRNPKWVIEKASVLLKITLWWDSGRMEKCFVISNEQKTINSFHIGEYPNEKCK